VTRGIPESPDIALIQAPLGRPEPPVYPLGIVTLAGCIPDSSRIRIFDPNLTGEKPMHDALKKHPPDVIQVFRQPVFFGHHRFSRDMGDARGDHPGGFSHGMGIYCSDAVGKMHFFSLPYAEYAVRQPQNDLREK